MPVDKEKEDVQWDNWLQEAVKKIRTQKQRPGLDRIYNAVRLLAEKQELAEHSQKSPIAPIYHVQVNQIKIEQVQRHLDRAVKKGLLLKVYSKGQATYKAVEKSERTLNLSTAGDNGGGNGGNGELSKCIIKVIRELSECDAPVPTSSSVTVSSLASNIKQPKPGYTFDTIEEYVRHSHVIIYPDDCQPDWFPTLVKQAIGKEVGRGKLEIVNGEYYRLPPASSQGSGTPAPPSSSSTSASSKGKTSGGNPTISLSSSSNNNSNSSWSSTASSSTAAASNAPTTFSGISASVNSKVKSAPTTTTTGGTGSHGSPLIKKGSVSSSLSSSCVTTGSATPPSKLKSKEGSPPLSSSSSPPRGNLAGDLSEAEEIALVTEQTARAVQLVMKDRRPGEKPSKKSSPPPNSADIGQKKNSQPPQQKESSPMPNAAEKDAKMVQQQKTKSNPSSSSSDEDNLVTTSVKRVSPTGETSNNNSGNGSGGSNGNGNGKSGNGTAVIKLMVPTFPGRNGNNGNGSNGKSTASSSNPTGSGGGGNKPVSPTTTPTVATTHTNPSQGKGLASSTSSAEKNSKTVGSGSSSPSTSQQGNNNPSSINKGNNSSTGGGALSISSIASVIMNKEPCQVPEPDLNEMAARMRVQFTSASPEKETASSSKTLMITQSSAQQKEHCMVCFSPNIRNITKDSHYSELIAVYLKTITGNDIELDECAKMDLCAGCFEKLTEFQNVSDLWFALEMQSQKTRIEMLRKMFASMEKNPVIQIKNEPGVEATGSRIFNWQKAKEEVKLKHGGDNHQDYLDNEEKNIDKYMTGYKVTAKFEKAD